ncbi:carbonic anhydrase [Azohydromonas aeria]|uniref:carbonic anhydrase n=1 Tax=Azohydromonas aeria TaxID=2590212 RepID=UPI0012FC6693|nr:carbonic anhydrase [Azohydromonas aeria]
MDLPTRLLLENQAWADEIDARAPAYFERMSAGQQPGVFWIGCADSRVPAERIVNAAPGELFVHRSIANLALPDDNSVMSALQYALDVLGVGAVIVCGHDACGGVRAAMLPPAQEEGEEVASLDQARGDYLAERIRPLRRLYRQHRHQVEAAGESLDGDAALAAQVDRLVTLNVVEQVRALAGTALVQRAWQRGQPLRLLGWVYGLRNGRLRQVHAIDAPGVALRQAA